MSIVKKFERKDITMLYDIMLNRFMNNLKKNELVATQGQILRVLIMSKKLK